jgi:hypothetical protein
MNFAKRGKQMSFEIEVGKTAHTKYLKECENLFSTNQPKIQTVDTLI